MAAELVGGGLLTTSWQRDRLAEARAILADAAHHRDSLNLLACRVVLNLSLDRKERADAHALIRLLEGGTP